MRRLENKIALLTGAGSGIGRAAALAFADEGARLALADLNGDSLEQVAREVRAKTAPAIALRGDISNASFAQRTVEEAVNHYGRLDVLVNNAGIDLQARLEETSEEDWDRVMAVNIKAMFLLCKHAVPHFVRAGGGAIVNVSSATALVPLSGRPAYNASKGAVVAFTKSLAADLAPSNIRANCICPGAVDTPLLRKALEAAPDPNAARAGVLSRYPLARLAMPEEIASVIVFLACADSAYVTGATLAVDGGRTMH